MTSCRELTMENPSCFRLKRYVLFCCIFLVTLDGYIVHGIRNIEMSSYCDKEISMIYKSLYQLRLTLDVQSDFIRPYSFSRHKNTSICDTRIEAWYSRPNLMFYIDQLDLDCDDGYLQFYDGYSSSGLNLDPYLGLQNVCGTDYPKGVYTTNSMYVRVRYVARKQHWKPNVMDLIVTAYSEDNNCESYEYKCDNGRCIDDDVSCSGFNSCGDNSECQVHLTVAAIIGIAIGSVIGLIFIVSIVVCVVCVTKKSKGRTGTTQNVAFQQQPVVYNPANPQPIGYGVPPPGQAQYGFQSTNYGQPQPTNYGQPQPTNYGQPQPTNYGQPQPGNVYQTQSNNLYPTQALANPQVTEPK